MNIKEVAWKTTRNEEIVLQSNTSLAVYSMRED